MSYAVVIGEIANANDDWLLVERVVVDGDLLL